MKQKTRVQNQTQHVRGSWRTNFLAYYATLPTMVVLVVALGWHAVLHQNQALAQAVTTAYQQAGLEIVRTAARSVEQYVHDQTQTRGRQNSAAIEREACEQFVAPLTLLEHSAAWVYTPDHVVFAPGSDFPDEYRDQSLAEIFARQAANGASHYENLTDAVTHAREGTGWYIWLPEKGREIAAWTPVQVGGQVWIIGLSTPLAEILDSTGAARQMRGLEIIMGWETAGAFVLLLAWVAGALQRQRTDRALHESEERFRAIVETARDSIFLKDRAQRYEMVNPAMEHLTGLVASEMVGHTAAEIFDPEDSAGIAQVDTLVLAGETIELEENVAVNGVLRTFHIVKVPMRDADGTITGLCGIARDITALVRTKREIEERRMYLEGILEAAPDAIVTLDAHHRIVEWNPGAEKLFGYSPEEAVGGNLDDMITNSDVRKEALAFTNQALGERKPVGPVETIRYRRDGSPVHVILSGSPIILEDELIGAVAAYTDITWRVQAAQALRESEKRYRDLVTNSLVGIYITQHHVLKFCNQKFATMFGYQNAEQVIGKSVRELVAPESWALVDREVKLRESAQKEISNYEFKGVRADGSIFDIQVMGKRITYQGEPAIQGTMIDITERKLAEQELRRYTAELEANNDELNAFAHTVAHDLKGPLSYIVGFTELLREDCTTLEPREMRSRLQAIARRGRHMGNIIDSLLLLAGVRQTKAQIAPLDMGHIVAAAQERLRPTIEKHQAEIILPQVWPVALGYGPWVEEVWVNYLDNALKYGGRPAEQIPPRIELGCDPAANSFIRFWVRDNGLALGPEAQAQLFTPFTRIDPLRSKGHGLGLSIVRRIVEKLGGQVGVESETGRGNIFFFTLPDGGATPDEPRTREND